MSKDKEEYSENEDEINDVDENFGLPDLEPEPLDDIEESPSDEASDYGDEFSNTEEYGNDYSQDSESSSEEVYSETDSSYNDGYGTDDSSTEDYPEEEQKSEYVPGTYANKAHEQQSNVGKVILIVLLLLIAGGGAWWWFSYRPAQIAKEKAQKERLAAEKKKKEEEKLLAEKAAEEERIAQEEARRKEQEAAQPQTGAIETISERTSRYYVVVSSSIDGDLAMDWSKKEIQKGTNIKILSPTGTNKFYRVTVGDYDTWADAESAAIDMKATFGETWVLKF